MSAKKSYQKGELTINWEADKCIHSELCWRGLISVFNPKKRPWINVEGAEAEEIVAQVQKCPSGALSYEMAEENAPKETLETVVEVIENGPLLVYGTLKISYPNGGEEVKNKTTAFCRCGASKNKPYCDGAHTKINFKG